MLFVVVLGPASAWVGVTRQDRDVLVAFGVTIALF
jgi:hypothetical protein